MKFSSSWIEWAISWPRLRRREADVVYPYYGQTDVTPRAVWVDRYKAYLAVFPAYQRDSYRLPASFERFRSFFYPAASHFRDKVSRDLVRGICSPLGHCLLEAFREFLGEPHQPGRALEAFLYPAYRLLETYPYRRRHVRGLT